MRLPESPVEVPAETAYEVAISKLNYLLTACVLAEAQVLDLRRRNERLAERIADLEERGRDATCPENAEGSAPNGAAGSAYDFSD